MTDNLIKEKNQNENLQKLSEIYEKQIKKLNLKKNKLLEERNKFQIDLEQRVNDFELLSLKNKQLTNQLFEKNEKIENFEKEKNDNLKKIKELEKFKLKFEENLKEKEEIEKQNLDLKENLKEKEKKFQNIEMELNEKNSEIEILKLKLQFPNQQSNQNQTTFQELQKENIQEKLIIKKIQEENNELKQSNQTIAKKLNQANEKIQQFEKKEKENQHLISSYIAEIEKKRELIEIFTQKFDQSKENDGKSQKKDDQTQTIKPTNQDQMEIESQIMNSFQNQLEILKQENMELKQKLENEDDQLSGKVLSKNMDTIMKIQGKSFSETFSDYIQLKAELKTEKEENQKLKEILERINWKLESKLPLIKEQEEKYERLKYSNKYLSDKLKEYIAKENSSKQTIEVLEKESLEKSKSIEILQEYNSNLGNQLKYLLSKDHNLKSGSINNEEKKEKEKEKQNENEKEIQNENENENENENKIEMEMEMNIEDPKRNIQNPFFENLEDLQKTNEKLSIQIIELNRNYKNLEKELIQNFIKQFKPEIESLQSKLQNSYILSQNQMKLIFLMYLQRNQYRELLFDQLKSESHSEKDDLISKDLEKIMLELENQEKHQINLSDEKIIEGIQNNWNQFCKENCLENDLELQNEVYSLIKNDLFKENVEEMTIKDARKYLQQIYQKMELENDKRFRIIYILQQENISLTQKIKGLNERFEHENEQKKSQFKGVNEELLRSQTQNQILQEKVNVLTNAINIMKMEAANLHETIQRMNENANNLELTNQEIGSQYQLLEKTLNESEIQKQRLTSEMESLKRNQSKISQENEQLKSDKKQIKLLFSNFQDYHTSSQSLLHQKNIQLTISVQDLEKQNQELKSKIELMKLELDDKVKQMDQLQEEIKKVQLSKPAIKPFSVKFPQIDIPINSTETDPDQSILKFGNSYNENILKQEIQNQIESKKEILKLSQINEKEKNRLMKQNKELENENKQITELKKEQEHQKNQEIRKLTQNKEQLEKKMAEKDLGLITKEQKIFEYEEQFIELENKIQELEKKNQELAQMNQEIQKKAKLEIESSDLKYEKEFSNHVMDLNKLREEEKENEELKESQRIMGMEIQQLHKKLDSLEKQNEMLKMQLNLVKKEFELHQSQSEEISISTKQEISEQKKNIIETLENEMRIIQAENENLRFENQRINEELKNRETLSSFSIQKNTPKIEEIFTSFDDNNPYQGKLKEESFQQLFKENKDLKEKLSKKLKEFQKLENEMEIWKKKERSLSENINVLNLDKQKLLKENERWKTRIAEMFQKYDYVGKNITSIIARSFENEFESFAVSLQKSYNFVQQQMAILTEKTENLFQKLVSIIEKTNKPIISIKNDHLNDFSEQEKLNQELKKKLYNSIQLLSILKNEIEQKNLNQNFNSNFNSNTKENTKQKRSLDDLKENTNQILFETNIQNEIKRPKVKLIFPDQKTVENFLKKD